MTPDELNAFHRSLPGIILNQEEVLLAQPDPPFFLALARAHGRPSDVRFFEAYAATLPDGVWPSYLEQQTDVTGCTKFGAGELVARYSGWLRFRRTYPRAYRDAVSEELEKIETEVGESTCACSTPADTLRELQQFAARFPRSRVIAKVRLRIRELRVNRSNIRFECMSG